MSNLFESIKQGLVEAIQYEKGSLPEVKVDKLSKADIKEKKLVDNLSDKHTRYINTTNMLDIVD